MDEKDRTIIERLRENARISYGEIARILRISDVAVMKRVKKLEREGVIKKYTVEVDDAKLGYGSVSLTGIDVEPEHLFNTAMQLKDKDHVAYLAITSGDHQIMTVIKAKDNEEMAKIHEEISGMTGVRRVCPSIVQDVIKKIIF